MTVPGKILLCVLALVAAGTGTYLEVGYRRALPVIARLEADVSERRQRLTRQLAQTASAATPMGTAQNAASGSLEVPPSGDATFDTHLRSVVQRVQRLKARIVGDPRLQIPELRFLGDATWFEVAERHPKLETDLEVRVALHELREAAGDNCRMILTSAARAYQQASGGRLPAQMSELRPYLVTPVDAALLDRYEFGSGSFVGVYGPSISSKAPVIDPELEKAPSTSFPRELSAALIKAMEAFALAHPDRTGAETAELLPYFENKAEAERFLKWEAESSKTKTAPAR